MGIHYDYKSKRGERAMLKEAKRKARLEQRKLKRKSSQENKEPEKKMHDIGKTITARLFYAQAQAHAAAT